MAGSTQVGNAVVNNGVTYQLPLRDGISHGTLVGMLVVEISTPNVYDCRRRTWVSIVTQRSGRWTAGTCLPPKSCRQENRYGGRASGRISTWSSSFVYIPNLVSSGRKIYRNIHGPATDHFGVAF
jgi:hypothetical protein